MIIPIKYDGDGTIILDEQELRAVTKRVCGVHCRNCETPVELTCRQRETDMADILNLAIEKELNEKERKVIYSIYFEEKTVPAIAKELGDSERNVRRIKTVAHEKLYQSLKYLNFYLTNLENDGVFETHRYLTILKHRHQRPKSCGGKIKQIRLLNRVSRKKLAEITGIGENRLKRIEGEESEPSAQEIIALCDVFSLTPNRLLGYEVENEEKS